jgi:hypothetical protein
MKLHLHGPFLDGQTDEASQYMETMIQTWHIKMELWKKMQIHILSHQGGRYIILGG